MHPFLDVSKLTDEDIIDRLGKSYNFMNGQKSLGHSPTVLSIQEVIQALENERATRLQTRMSEEFKKKYPGDLKPLEIGKLEDEA
jgi:hypothetical protein